MLHKSESKFVAYDETAAIKEGVSFRYPLQEGLYYLPWGQGLKQRGYVYRGVKEWSSQFCDHHWDRRVGNMLEDHLRKENWPLVGQ